MRAPFLAALLLTAASDTTGPAAATEIDLKLGVRSFGDDGESWPEIGLGLRFGSERWVLRPELSGALAEDPLYAGRIFSAGMGIGGDLPHRGSSVVSWGLGYNRLRYELGANEGEADAFYGELAWRWVRPDAADLGVSLRYVDGADIVLESGYAELLGEEVRFRESISTVVASFLMRW